MRNFLICLLFFIGTVSANQEDDSVEIKSFLWSDSNLVVDSDPTEVRLIEDGKVVGSCEADLMQLSQGLISVQCVDDGPGPGPGPIPVKRLGQLENYQWITLEQELSGDIDETVYVPNRSNPDLIIYEGIRGEEIVYPGCAGVPPDNLRECQLNGSLTPSKIYTQRIRTGSTYVSFSTSMIGDQLGSYDVGVASIPDAEVLDEPQSLCVKKGRSRGGIYVDPNYSTSYSCDVEWVGNNIYTMFRPHSPEGDSCGSSKVCRIRVVEQ